MLIEGRINNVDGQTSVPTDLKNVVQIVSGSDHTCALGHDGSVTCWGLSRFNSSGYYEQIVQVAVARSDTCVLNSSGKVRCVDSDDKNLDVPSNLNNVTQITGNGRHFCALMNNDKVQCWPEDRFYGESVVPSDVKNVIQVSAGDSPALRSN